MARLPSGSLAFSLITYQYDTYGQLIRENNAVLDKTYVYEYNGDGNSVNPIRITYSTKSIASRNPIRYRGYYYDQDTKLYYLNARYYCPEWRRFISPDNTSYLNSGTNGLNLYCYCNNDPVNCVDPSGHAWYNKLWDWVNTIAGFINPISKVTAVGAIVASAFNDNWSGLVDDYNAGRLNPFNQDATLAGEANVLSFYNGSTVIHQNIVSTCSAFGTIWKNGVEDQATIMHEYGHSVQERILGPAYWTNIAIPSMLYCEFGSDDSINYYSTPWERTADWLGGVKKEAREDGYKKGSLAWGFAENLLGPIVIPFYFIFGY